MTATLLIHGDARQLPLRDSSIDAIVTDPPYGLGFMGKAWDHGVPGVPFWLEALRVLKPGGHLLAFGGTRTFHRQAVAIEDAGFEVRDCLSWLYGSGFPKSLDVSKAIDKVNGEGDRLHRFTAWMRSTGVSGRRLDELTGTQMGSHYLRRKSQPAIPTPELWALIRPHLGEVPAWVDELVTRVEAERAVVASSSNGIAGGTGRHAGEEGRYGFGASFDLTAPATGEAAAWEGWGTALKPAWEPIVLARKPLVGTVAGNVLAHGTGALNIDAVRIASGDDCARTPALVGDTAAGFGKGREMGGNGSPLGRWPANVVLDETAATLLDTQTGETSYNPPGVFGRVRTDMQRSEPGAFAVSKAGNEVSGYGDRGGASRFFYVAKPSKAERNAGLAHMPERETIRYGEQGQGPRAQQTPRKPVSQTNHHPTVKPVALMRWLVRLVTPPGGVVLDPFMGSGTTLEAATLEGFHGIGVELTAEYLPLARGRNARPLQVGLFS